MLLLRHIVRRRQPWRGGHGWQCRCPPTRHRVFRSGKSTWTSISPQRRKPPPRSAPRCAHFFSVAYYSRLKKPTQISKRNPPQYARHGYIYASLHTTGQARFVRIHNCASDSCTPVCVRVAPVSWSVARPSHPHPGGVIIHTPKQGATVKSIISGGALPAIVEQRPHVVRRPSHCGGLHHLGGHAGMRQPPAGNLRNPVWVWVATGVVVVR